MAVIYPTIPQNITVHLGPPDSDARNVTVPFKDYIKNVASSEIYPTWNEQAIYANIYAQLSFALNRKLTSSPPTTAAVMPPAVAFRPPVNTPKKPSSATASRTPFARL